jgi:hypothetical protein
MDLLNIKYHDQLLEIKQDHYYFQNNSVCILVLLSLAYFTVKDLKTIFGLTGHGGLVTKR